MRTLLLLALVACVPPTPPPAPVRLPGGLVTFVVDERFRDTEKVHIVEAAATWGRMGVPFAITSADHVYRFGTPPRAVWIVPTQKPACGDAGCWIPPSRIELDPDMLTVTGTWALVVEHEMGHALGLHDVNAGLSIMRRNVPDQARRPTELDLAALRKPEDR